MSQAARSETAVSPDGEENDGMFRPGRRFYGGGCFRRGNILMGESEDEEAKIRTDDGRG
jgi:hypothetical protein